MEKKNYAVHNLCTADIFDEITCINYQPNPFEHRYKICFYRLQNRVCKHSSNVGLDKIIDNQDCIPLPENIDE